MTTVEALDYSQTLDIDELIEMDALRRSRTDNGESPTLDIDELIEMDALRQSRTDNAGEDTALPDYNDPVVIDAEETAAKSLPPFLSIFNSNKTAMEAFEEEEEELPQPPVILGQEKGVEEELEALTTISPGCAEHGKYPLEESTSLLPHEVLEEDDEGLLTEDAYSLLYTASCCGMTALFAWFSIMLQGGMLLMTFLDLFDYSPEGNDTNGSTNRMSIPVGATIQVMIAQFLGMLLTAMVMAAQGDMVIGVTQLIKGYDPKIREQSPNATWGRWLMTGLLQSIVGVLLLFDSLVLSMQSTTVIDLALNLTALHFIQEVDEMAFVLASESGLFNSKVQADCEHVKTLKRYSTPADRKASLLRRRCLIALMTIGLLIPYFLVIARQYNGHYTCDNLYVQFGDEYTPQMAHYSGMFRSQGNGLRQRKGQRNFYIDDSKTYKVAFCNAENYWTVSGMDEEACDYIYRSAETETFDIIEAADENWFVTTNTTGDVDADWLGIVCNECNEDNCAPENGVCSEAGDECVCLEGSVGLKFGLNCQFEENCIYAALDERTRDGLEAISGTASFLKREYVSISILVNISFYDRPIYVPVNETNFLPTHEVDSFIVFTGRRWVIYSIPDGYLRKIVNEEGQNSNWSFYGSLGSPYDGSPDQDDDSYDLDTLLDDVDTFPGYFNDLATQPTHVDALKMLTGDLINYFPVFFSSPLNYGENYEGFEPTTVSWVHTTYPYDKNNPIIPGTPAAENPLSARFLCSNCNQTGGCFNGGICTEGGFCICETFYSGHLCERVKDCVGAGGCNSGTCNEVTRTCDCNEGSYGSLCQLGEGAVPDPFLCSICEHDYDKGFAFGRCNSTFSLECTCDEGYEGEYCDEPIGGGIEEFDLPTGNITLANNTV